MVRYLMSVHLSNETEAKPRAIYLTRHGESIFNKQSRIGGDSGLTVAGQQYSAALKSFMDSQVISFYNQLIVLHFCSDFLRLVPFVGL